MNNQKGSISALVLIICFALVIVIVGGAIYFDSTDSWHKLGLASTPAEQSTDDENIENTNEGQEVIFVSYQSPDQLYQLQIPDFWTGEERDGAAIFYSYNPADEEPEQRAKIEVGRVANPDILTTLDWLAANNIDATPAQQANFGDISGAMILQDNTEANPNDIKSTIYLPVNDIVIIVSAESFGGTRDVAVQFFNAILNSWQWISEVSSPDQLAMQNADDIDTTNEDDTNVENNTNEGDDTNSDLNTENQDDTSDDEENPDDAGDTEVPSEEGVE
jgi:hypothetical protein